VLCKDGDVFAGEDEPPTPIRWPWEHDAALVVDTFGVARQIDVRDGQVQVPVSITPVFISPLASV
jgi:hypothetical protein